MCKAIPMHSKPAASMIDCGPAVVVWMISKHHQLAVEVSAVVEPTQPVLLSNSENQWCMIF
jgi:hypothetical protein